MPDFPRHQSQREITTQQPSIQAADDPSGESISNLGKIGQTVQDVSVKWSNAVDTIQKTTAQANFETGILDIQNRAQNDPNYNNSEQYFKEIEKLKKDSIKGFSSKRAEAETMIDLGYKGQVAQIQIDNLYKKKMIGVYKGSLKQLVYNEISNPTEYSMENIKGYLDIGKRDLLISEEEYQDELYKSKQSVGFNSFLRDFRNDPVAAEKSFSKNAYAMDAETSEKARVKLKELKVMQKEQEGEIYSDMGLRVATGEITDDEIEQAIQANKLNPNEGITETHGKQLLAARYRDITKRIGAKEFQKHKKAIDFVFSSSAQDRVKGYEAILEAYEDGLSGDDAKFLNQVLKTKKDVVWANKAAAGKKMIQTLFGAKPKDVERETQSLLSYAKRIAEGSSPEQAAQQTAIEVVQQDHPATIADPDLVVAFTPSKGLKNIPKIKPEKKAEK